MQAAVTLGSACKACRTLCAASASWKVSAAALFWLRASARMDKFRTIDCLNPDRSKIPMETKTVNAVMQAIATNNPVSLWRIDQSRNGFNFNIREEPYLTTSFARLRSWELIRSPAWLAIF